MVDAGTGSKQFMAVTDTLGWFEFDAIPPAIPGSERTVVSLCGKQTVLDSPGAIVGRICDADSALPVSGANLVVTWSQALFAKRKHQSTTRTTDAVRTTDATGRFVLPGLRAGTFDVEVRATGHEARAAAVYSTRQPRRDRHAIDTRSTRDRHMEELGDMRSHVSISKRAGIHAAVLLICAIAVVPASAQTTERPPSARVSGTVYDSVAHGQLGGAQVQFVDAATKAKIYSAQADSAGRYHIDSMPPGKYIAGFFHPSVDVLGIESPLRSVTVTPGVPNVVDLGIPGAARVLTTLCGAKATKDSTAALAGVVRDAGSGAALSGATVVVTWLEMLLRNNQLISQERTVPIKTDADGGYRMCGLPGGDTLYAEVAMNGLQSGAVMLDLAPGQMQRRDFSLGDSASVHLLVLDSTDDAARAATTVLRGSASLTGIVLGVQHQPLEGARILVRGTGLDVVTGSDGRFALKDLPAGTFSVEARAIGLEPRFIPLDFAAGVKKTVQINLDTKLQELSRVVVVGNFPKPRRDIEEFERRRKTGVGHFYEASDLTLRQASSLSDLFDATMGLRVMPTRMGHAIFMRDGCPAAVYLDGIKMREPWETVDNIPPNQVAGIEIYKGTLEEPARYNGNSCGVILIWRKR
ncbi:MAG: carboxypeptidase regulatory-like domain-containing protein [Gemmatimonadaceae bacterium]